VRIRLIVAFIVVALLTAVATAWVINLVVPWYPWLRNLVPPTPRLLSHLLYTGSLKYDRRHPARGGVPPPPGALAFCLLVRDQGPGIPPDALPHVFERFYKADTARSRSEDSGLGLAIAWENTRLHGGHIEAANHPGGGALFTLLLPLNRAEPAMLPDDELVTVTRL
jgi:hypothetical protein